MIARGSDIEWVADVAKLKRGEGLTYDWKASFVSDGRPRVDVVLNRVLRGVPFVPIDMIRQMDLVELARMDLEGFCVPVQLHQVIRKRFRPGPEEVLSRIPFGRLRRSYAPTRTWRSDQLHTLIHRRRDDS